GVPSPRRAMLERLNEPFALLLCLVGIGVEPSAHHPDQYLRADRSAELALTEDTLHRLAAVFRGVGGEAEPLLEIGGAGGDAEGGKAVALQSLFQRLRIDFRGAAHVELD